MGKKHAPRRGSMQFWPRKRARKILARVRSWPTSTKTSPLAFIGYKVRMTQVLFTDNRSKSMTKGEQIAMPSTIIECPPLFVAGITFYKKAYLGKRNVYSVLADKLNKHFSKKLQLPKKQKTSLDNLPDYDSLRLFVQTQPHLTSVDGVKPSFMEISLGGNKEDQFNFAKENLGKEIPITDLFSPGTLVDIRGVTRGKGFQGTVKRFGVPIRSKKSEKTKRGIGNLGSWTPKRVDFRVPQPGKMGFHLRTEYNKTILVKGDNSKLINPKSGFHKYGEIKNSYLIVKGSVVGSTKRPIVLTVAQRPNKKLIMEAADPVLTHLL